MQICKVPAAFIVALGFLADPAAASQEGIDMKLEDAGFKMRAADTTEKAKHARMVPPRTFIARSKNGQRYYIYADPDFCKCVFVGDETAMKTYRDMTAPPKDLPPGVTPAFMTTQDIDANVSSAINDGHILDWKF